MRHQRTGSTNSEVDAYLRGGGKITHLPESVERDSRVYTAQPKQHANVDRRGCEILNPLMGI